jgi:C-terminal processing protease CtpA/Prc
LPAWRSPRPNPPPAQQQELDAARTQLDQAAQRYAELSRKYGDADAPIRIEKRVLRKPVIGVVLAADDRSGVRIAAVTPGSAAADAGLKTGDRITSVDGKRVDAGAGDARVASARVARRARCEDAGAARLRTRGQACHAVADPEGR